MFEWLLRYARESFGSSGLRAQRSGSHSPHGGVAERLAVGVRNHQEGHLREAEASYQDVLSQDPNNFDALHLLGVIAHQRGQHQAAADRITRALTLNPDDVPAHNNLGVALRALGKFEEALACFRKALNKQPHYPDARTNLFETHLLVANALKDRGELKAAGDHFGKALALKPDSAAVNINYGNVLNQQGRAAEAIGYYERAIELDPEIPEAYLNLGNALKECGKIDEAVASYRHTLTLRPDWANAYYLLGNALKDQDDLRGMRDCYRRALALRPEYSEARWALAMCQIPAVYETESEPAQARANFSRELGELEHWFDTAQPTDAVGAVGVMQPFLLAYQEEENRALLERYGNLCSRIMSSWFERQSLSQAKHGPIGRPLKVGVLSRHFFNHSVWNAIVKGWFEHLDRNRFRLQAFYLGTQEDEETRRARNNATHFHMGNRDLLQWVEEIIGRELDVLIYPEVGMDPMTARLASLRLAPVQVASWGHPESTGLPTIDYYFSAEGFEAEGSEVYYRERLVKLPHLGCCYESADVVPVEPALDGSESTPVLVCPGVPFKYAPQYDRVLVEIARRLGRCRFVFFTHPLKKISEKLKERLARGFARKGLDAEQFITFVPWQTTAQFHGWLRASHVFLDTIGFSGFNTAMQAVECGTPIVTREGRFMRGRLASGILQRMGLNDLVAMNLEEYIALSVKLARDEEYRQHIRERIKRSRDILFRDEAPIRALEDFLTSVSPQ